MLKPSKRKVTIQNTRMKFETKLTLKVLKILPICTMLFGFLDCFQKENNLLIIFIHLVLKIPLNFNESFMKSHLYVIKNLVQGMKTITFDYDIFKLIYKVFTALCSQVSARIMS